MIKIKLPKFNGINWSGCNENFRTLDDFIYGNVGIIRDSIPAEGGFPFGAYLTYDNDADSYFVYGYISYNRYYDYAFVVSDDINCKTIKQFKRAYKTVEEQLVKRYKQWVLDNMFEKEK